MPREHLHFVTGRLAEHALRSVVARLAEQVGFDYTIDVLPITVAALMTPAPTERDAFIAFSAERASLFCSPRYFDRDQAAERAAARARTVKLAGLAGCLT